MTWLTNAAFGLYPSYVYSLSARALSLSFSHVLTLSVYSHSLTHSHTHTLSLWRRGMGRGMGEMLWFQLVEVQLVEVPSLAVAYKLVHPLIVLHIVIF